MAMIMAKIKLCGLTRMCDIDVANECRPDYIGFVFAPKSRRYLSPQKAAELKKRLSSDILAVGVFVDETVSVAAKLLQKGIIDLAQLHGSESEDYIKTLQECTGRPVIKAFRIDGKEDILSAKKCCADHILLDSGAGGTGTVFNWDLLRSFDRPYFLAGGLDLQNIEQAVRTLHPYAVDVSSGIETDGKKDHKKMREFVHIVRKA